MAHHTQRNLDGGNLGCTLLIVAFAALLLVAGLLAWSIFG